jgi:hypothetical protein
LVHRSRISTRLARCSASLPSSLNVDASQSCSGASSHSGTPAWSAVSTGSPASRAFSGWNGGRLVTSPSVAAKRDRRLRRVGGRRLDHARFAIEAGHSSRLITARSGRRSPPRVDLGRESTEICPVCPVLGCRSRPKWLCRPRRPDNSKKRARPARNCPVGVSPRARLSRGGLGAFPGRE